MAHNIGLRGGRIVKTGISLSLFLSLVVSMTGCDLFLGPSHTVTYDGNGALAGAAPIDEDTYRKGDTFTVMNSGTLAWNGYEFEGWSEEAGGSGTLHDPGQVLEMGTEDMTLYASWRSISYSNLVSGSQVSLARFNDTYIYTIVAATPPDKPESNNPPATEYDYTLTTAAARSASMSPASGIRSPAPSGRGSALSARALMDLKCREMENRLLASGARQVDGRSASRAGSAPASIAIGTAWNDVLISDTLATVTPVDTNCRHISSHAYIFVDNADGTSMDAWLDEYGTAFDAIYHVNRDKFGFENDTDRNGKVILVFSSSVFTDFLGYFWSVDKFPWHAVDNPYSNEGDIFYLNTDHYTRGAPDSELLGTLAHEFQHMIYFDEHYDRGASGSYSWLNEALSMVAEYFNDYQEGELGWIKSFLLDYGSELSLTHWTSDNYGYGAIYMQYLLDRFGEDAVKEMCATNLIGIEAVEAATAMDFNELFTDFSRALVMSGTGDSDDPRYEFLTLDLADVQPTGRGGLLPYDPASPLESGDSDAYWVYPYSLEFSRWHGDFGTMKLSGADVTGTAFGLRR